jgi:hypothetical protein
MVTQRMQKALTLMNLQLRNVISDVTGLTGMAILREIANGEIDPATLSRHRDRRCKATEQEIAASLTGSYREEHLFVLCQTLEVYDFYREKIERCDDQIEVRLRALEARCEPPATPLSAPRSNRKRKLQDNAPSFEIRSPLTQPSGNRAAKMFRIGAMAIGRSDHALGAFYRRLAVRLGKPKAITATARKLALLFYRMLKHKMSYVETSAVEYDERQRNRILRSLGRRARSLGFDLVDASTGLVM